METENLRMDITLQSMFQKDLIVWKRGLHTRVIEYELEMFQKDLIVWKHRIQKDEIS